MTLTRRNFIKGAILTSTAIINMSITGCYLNKSNDKNEILKNCYIITYNTDNGEENMLTYFEDGDIYVCYKDLSKGKKLSSSKSSYIYEAYERLNYFSITSRESLLKLLIKKYGYKENYVTEEIETILNNYSSEKEATKKKN